MEERDEEECEFWKKEDEEHERQNEQKMREEEEVRRYNLETDDDGGRHGLSREATENVDEEGEEGREAKGLTSPMLETKDGRDT